MNKFTNGKQASQYFGELYGIKTLRQVKRYDKVIGSFRRNFKKSFCHVATSSGRVEFIGNHTDHNGGQAVGCTIDLDIVGAFLPNDTGKVCIKSARSKDLVFDVNDCATVEGGSIGLIKGVLNYLQTNGYKVGGFDAYTHSTVLSGAGISSSAAFECLIGAIINYAYNDGNIPADVIARAGQYAENVYYGKNCGLLDQGVVAVGGVVSIDFCNVFEYSHSQNTLSDVTLVLIDTGKSHSNLSHLYSAIPTEMKSVAEFFGKTRLIDVDKALFYEQYAQAEQACGTRPVLRAKHFFEENARVEQLKTALENYDTATVLQLVNGSGESSRYQLQNCAVDENDTVIGDAIDYAHSVCPSCGARVHGGGFAGTVLCVVPTEQSKTFVAEMQHKYGKNRVFPLRVRSVGATVL